MVTCYLDNGVKQVEELWCLVCVSCHERHDLLYVMGHDLQTCLLVASEHLWEGEG